ncbi:hypothetical protein EB28_01593 [Enterococcus faecalis]|nr:hypothetical protein EB28_01593 [Enterococcus faecalis]
MLIDYELSCYGVEQNLKIELKNENNSLLISGASGSGKTVLLKALIVHWLRQTPDATFLLRDFKSYDFRFCHTCSNYYAFEKVTQGIEASYTEFKKRQNLMNQKYNDYFLIIDEYAAYLEFLDKKERELIQRRVAELLMMGRAYNIHLVFVLQRADAKYFPSVRENIGIRIGLGKLSKSLATMLFEESEYFFHGSRTGALVKANDTEIQYFKLQTIREINQLDRHIKQLLK